MSEKLRRRMPQGASCAAFPAVLKLTEKLGAGKTVAMILPDTAERYFSTPLFADEAFS